MARLADVRLDEPLAAYHVVVDVDPVKALATRLWRVHPPQALGALPPGTALHWAEGHPRG